MSRPAESAEYVYDDGGRASAGFKGEAHDCVTRAVAIASGRPYGEIYDVLSLGCKTERPGKRGARKVSARNGVYTQRAWFHAVMVTLGFEWVPTMQIGQGCTVHLTASELPAGRLVVNVSRHSVAMIDGVIHDTHDPRRGGRRCVYGYWRLLDDGSKQNVPAGGNALIAAGRRRRR